MSTKDQQGSRPDVPEMMKWDEWLERLVDRVVKAAIYEHQAKCPIQVTLQKMHNEFNERIGQLNVRFAYLVGLMVGSGIVGGVTVKVFGG